MKGAGNAIKKVSSTLMKEARIEISEREGKVALRNAKFELSFEAADYQETSYQSWAKSSLLEDNS